MKEGLTVAEALRTAMSFTIASPSQDNQGHSARHAPFPHARFTLHLPAGLYRLIHRAREDSMRTNLTIFLLFFGISMLDAIRGGHWLRILFWVIMAVFFLLADRRQMAQRASPER
jgi:hypothetical protein